MDIFDVIKYIYEEMKKIYPNFDEKGWNIVTQFNSDSTFKSYTTSTSTNIGYLNIWGGIFDVEDSRIVIPIYFSKNTPLLHPEKLLTANGFTHVDKESYTQFAIFCCSVILFRSFLGKTKVRKGGANGRKTRRRRRIPGGQRIFGLSKMKLLLLLICLIATFYMTYADEVGDMRLEWDAACKKEYNINDEVYQGQLYGRYVYKWHQDVEACKAVREDFYYNQQKALHDLEKAKVISDGEFWKAAFPVAGSVIAALVGYIFDVVGHARRLIGLNSRKEEITKLLPRMEEDIKSLKNEVEKEENTVDSLQGMLKTTEDKDKQAVIQTEIRITERKIKNIEERINDTADQRKVFQKSKSTVEEAISAENEEIQGNTKQIIVKLADGATKMAGAALDANIKKNVAEVGYRSEVAEAQYEYSRGRREIRTQRYKEANEQNIKAGAGLAGVVVGAGTFFVTGDPMASSAVAAATYEGINTQMGIEKNAALPSAATRAMSVLSESTAKRMEKKGKEREQQIVNREQQIVNRDRLANANEMIGYIAEQQKISYQIKHTKDEAMLRELNNQLIDRTADIDRAKVKQQYYIPDVSGSVTDKRSMEYAKLLTADSQNIAAVTEQAAGGGRSKRVVIKPPVPTKEPSPPFANGSPAYDPTKESEKEEGEEPSSTTSSTMSKRGRK
jgi:hypothetical protein